MIPLVPLPVFPYQDRDPLFGAGLRASDADRDVAADILCAAVADGRLTLAELEERLEGGVGRPDAARNRQADLRPPRPAVVRARPPRCLATRSLPARNPVVPPPVTARNA